MKDVTADRCAHDELRRALNAVVPQGVQKAAARLTGTGQLYTCYHVVTERFASEMETNFALLCAVTGLPERDTADYLLTRVVLPLLRLAYPRFALFRMECAGPGLAALAEAIGFLVAKRGAFLCRTELDLLQMQLLALISAGGVLYPDFVAFARRLVVAVRDTAAFLLQTGVFHELVLQLQASQAVLAGCTATYDGCPFRTLAAQQSQLEAVQQDLSVITGVVYQACGPRQMTLGGGFVATLWPYLSRVQYPHIDEVRVRCIDQYAAYL